MHKVKSLREIISIANKARRQKKTIVATNGCFDILHVGHARNFAAAKKLGDILIVGINSDASVRGLKGPTRPIVPEHERAEMVASLESVDYTFIFSERTPFGWIKKIRPHVHVKGGKEDFKTNPNLVEQKRVVEKSGGKFILVPHIEGKSTSNIIEKMLKAHNIQKKLTK